MNNNAQNGSFLQCYRQPNIAHAPPQWLVLRKSCELIVLRVVRDLITVTLRLWKKTGLMRMEGVWTTPNPPLAMPLTLPQYWQTNSKFWRSINRKALKVTENNFYKELLFIIYVSCWYDGYLQSWLIPFSTAWWYSTVFVSILCTIRVNSFSQTATENCKTCSVSALEVQTILIVISERECFNIPVNTLQVVSEMSLSSQSVALALVTFITER